MHASPRNARNPADFARVLDSVAEEAPKAIRRHRLRTAMRWTSFEKLFGGALCCASVAFFAFAYMVSVNDPDYFSRRLISSLQRDDAVDPITTGTVAASADTAHLAVPRVVRTREPVPGDYQIVMVFDREAILATDTELMRVRIGSVVPGLGEVTGIEQNPSGGVVTATSATLRAVAN